MIKNAFLLLLLSLALFSCQSKDSEVLKEFKVGKTTFTMPFPKDFRNATQKEIDNYYTVGNAGLLANGIVQSSGQNVLFFFKNGEFSSLSAKYGKLHDTVANNYYKSWKNMNRVTYIALTRTIPSEMQLDTLSRIEINGIQFYVFEKKITLSDTLGRKSHFNLLRYSTCQNKMDLNIDASFVDNFDKKEIMEAINGIQIKK